MISHPDRTGLIALLGPQSQTASVAMAVNALGVDGSIGAITAGWRDAEGDIGELTEHLGVEVTDLAVYERVEKIFALDVSLFRAHRKRQDILKQLQRLYRVRLRSGADACYRLMKRSEDAELVRLQLRGAISQLRALDRFHSRQIAKVHSEFEKEVALAERPAVREHRSEIAEQLSSLGAVLIAGGHVAVLASRLRLLGMRELLAGHALIGWSAGAMIMTDQLVLFHDKAPQGRREPELLDVGLGRASRIVALPAATQRLDLGQDDHLALMARRFAPASCLALDESDWIAWSHDRLLAARGVRRIKRNGVLAGVNAGA
ncbi:MAG: type 1 glutamine amidotransferase-like domain-containing protein [Gammaproteobacteria bacterium]|nr:type 1 glutamine amidotransferase-like domain-containing protein [Gammaproteobacteria bacterium]